MRTRRPTLLHRVEFLLFRLVGGIGTVLGERVAGAIGAALGRVVHWPLGIRRALVEDQIRRAFPERDEAWVRRTARAAFAHLGREAMAMLRLSALDAAAVRERTEIEGLEAFLAAFVRGRGVVLVTGHLGNWEIGGAALAARGVPLDGIAQRQSNPLFDAAIVAARERLGIRIIERGQAPRRALRSLREGRVVGFISDQDARRSGVFVPFFGRPASTHRGAALFALRAGAPLFLGSALRRPGGGYRVRIEEVTIERTGDLEADVARLTAAFTARLEAAVREAPEQYFWHHRRWKTRPPKEPPPRGSGISDRSGTDSVAGQ